MTLQERLQENPDEYVNYHTDAGETLSLPAAIFNSWTPSQRAWANSRLTTMYDPQCVAERALQHYKRVSADLNWRDRLERWLQEAIERSMFRYYRKTGTWKRPIFVCIAAFIRRSVIYRRFVLQGFAS